MLLSGVHSICCLLSGLDVGGKGFEGREKEEICIRKHEHATGLACKQEAEEQRPHRACGIPLYSKCHFAIVLSMAKFVLPEVS